MAVYSRLSPAQAADYNCLKDALLKRFQLTEEGFRNKFRTCSPDQGETPLQFVARLEHYLSRWVEMGKCFETFDGLKQLLLKEQFLNSCGKNLSVFLKEKQFDDLHDVVASAEKYLEAHGYKEFVRKKECIESVAEHSDIDTKTTPRRSSSLGRVLRTIRCYGCRQVGHKIKDCKLVQKHSVAFAEANPRRSIDRYNNSRQDVCFERRNVDNCRASRGNFRVGRGGYRYVGGREHKNQVDEVGDVDKKMGCFVGQRLSDCCTEQDTMVLHCGNELPLVSAACNGTVEDLRKLDAMPESVGLLNDRRVKVLRDTGCSGIIVRRDLVDVDDLTGEYKYCVLVDGSVRRFPIAKVDIQTRYFTGITEAMCVENPVYPLIIGNVKDPVHVGREGLKTQIRCTSDKQSCNEITEVKGQEVEQSCQGPKQNQISNEGCIEKAQAVKTRGQLNKEENGSRDNLNVPSPVSEVTCSELLDAQTADQSL